MTALDWNSHVLRCGGVVFDSNDPPDAKDHRKDVEPWLSALLQAEHVNLLIGSGFTTAVAHAAGAVATGMGQVGLDGPGGAEVNAAATRGAELMKRGSANIEDQIRAVGQLLDGLDVLTATRRSDPPIATELDVEFLDAAETLRSEWRETLDQTLQGFLSSLLQTEASIQAALSDADKGNPARWMLASFLLTFASRSGNRERLHAFTTNYDRLIEFGSDVIQLRILDRFVGSLEPTFASSRLNVDMHFNPPGIRGEPRYMEGVFRLTKLHGSIDWQFERTANGERRVVRKPLPFGAEPSHPGVPASPSESLMIYPNPAKDVETLQYPYADLFRDFAASTCRPNSVLVTYGYGFGDDHINRVLRDMLTLPSTHLMIISYDLASGRIPNFVDSIGRPDQISLLIGSVFGDLKQLVDHLLPKPAIDRTTWRMMELKRRRGDYPQPSYSPQSGDEAEEIGGQE